MKPLLLFLLVFTTLASVAQQKPCYTDEAEMKFNAKSTGLSDYRDKIESMIRGRMEKSVSYGESVTTIPVVVHVVYNTPVQNISDQQILSQIAVLNEDYRKLNEDTAKIRPVFQDLAGDVRVEFCLAQRDPFGNATTGITRTSTTVTDWGCDDSVKFTANGGIDAWPCDQYLNVWVCNLNCANGYAYYPGIPDEYDGVVIHYYVFGTTGYVFSGAHGRTTTHEIGHWLNLYHPFYDECLGADPQTCEILGDRVCDTPSDTITWDCTTTNACTDFPIDFPDQWENFMNYTEDSCRVMFTLGQIERMRAALYLARPTILTTPGCILPGTDYYDVAIASLIAPNAPQCHQYIAPEIRFGSGSTIPLTTATFNYKVDNGSWQQYTWTGSLNNSEFENVILPQAPALPGLHTMTIVASLPNGQTDMNANNDTLIFSFEVIEMGMDISFFWEGFDLPTFPPAGWSCDHTDLPVRWRRTSDAGSVSISSAFYDNFSLNDQGRRSSIYTPYLLMDATTCGCTYHYMSFDWAYPLPSPPGNSFADTLNIYYSTDCGDTWVLIWSRGGNDLATAPFYSYVTPFIPLANEWQTNVLDVSWALSWTTYFKFENVNDWGNRLYIDNINLWTVSIIPGNPLEYKISVFPSPVKNTEYLYISITPDEDISVNITDITGRIIVNESSDKQIKLNGISPGIYTVNVFVRNVVLFRQKIVVV